jgi:mRNA-degrading endonuclease RelE of RelBE toxin-antitoxin system
MKALHGKEWRGVFRRRIGNYRLLFSASREQGTVTVLRILLRSGETYR